MQSPPGVAHTESNLRGGVFLLLKQTLEAHTEFVPNLKCAESIHEFLSLTVGILIMNSLLSECWLELLKDS